MNSDKIVPPVPTTCWGVGSAMFKWLHHKNNGQAKIMKWEFKVKEGWLPYISLSSHLIASEKEFVYQRNGQVDGIQLLLPSMLRSLGPKGAFQLGLCGHIFHVNCIQ